MTLPNQITIGRILLIPVFVVLAIYYGRTSAAGHPDETLRIATIGVFLLAALSDGVDGWLARRYGGNSVGAILDPVADKALLVTMYVTLAAVNQLPDWLAILVVFRDLVIVGGVIVLAVLGDPVLIRPLFISKVNTLLQIMLVGVVMLQAGFGLSLWGVEPGLIWLVAASTFASGGAYVWVTARGR